MSPPHRRHGFSHAKQEKIACRGGLSGPTSRDNVILWLPYRSSKWHCRQRNFVELIMQFIAATATDTDNTYVGISFRSGCRHSCSLQFSGGHMADKNDFGSNFYFIADADTEKSKFRIICAMNSDKRYPAIPFHSG